VRALLGRSGLEDLAAIEHRVLEIVARSSQALTARAFAITQNTVDFVLNLFVMLYLLFFLLRDGPWLTAAAQRALPLRPDITRRLLREFAVVVRATVKGNVLIALVQGALGGLSFWVLGIQGAVLWGAVMAVLSLLPAIGAALVWGPVVLYLFATGQLWQAAALLAWSAGVIGLVDNALRPVLVGKDTRLPDYLVLIATLGGLSAFGPNGFVIGPAIAAVFIAAWDIYAETRAEQRAEERHEA
jgi:predicted PurR-regulated permease PerM